MRDIENAKRTNNGLQISIEIATIQPHMDENNGVGTASSRSTPKQQRFGKHCKENNKMGKNEELQKCTEIPTKHHPLLAPRQNTQLRKKKCMLAKKPMRN